MDSCFDIEMRQGRSLEEMDFIGFFKNKTSLLDERGVGAGRLRTLVQKLYDGKLYKEYRFEGEDSYTIKDHVHPIKKVGDVYSLSKREIYSIRDVGKATWKKLNDKLLQNNLPEIQLPYEYTTFYGRGYK